MKYPSAVDQRNGIGHTVGNVGINRLLRALFGGISVALVLVSCGRIDDTNVRSSNASEDTRLVMTSYGAVLPATAGKKLLTQCSRSTPSALKFWNPSLNDVSDLEKRLPSFLDSVSSQRPGMREGIRDDRYLRQYVGIIRWNGKRLIYINAFDRRYADVLNRSRLQAGQASGRAHVDTLKWRHHPISVCDGGQMFFGLEYDPAAGTFAHFRTNTSADGS